MLKTLSLATIAACTLTACGNSAAEQQGEAQAEAAATGNGMAAPVELPPAIQDTVTFRCMPGNVLQTVNFYAGGKQVGLQQGDSRTLTMLSRTEEQGPYTASPITTEGGGTAGAAGAAPAMPDAEGTTFTGDETNAVITLPGQPTLNCKT